jgi:septum formation protein
MKAKPNSKAPQLILASGSPRRIELLRAIGLNPEVFKPDVDETPVRGESARALVRRLARLKAKVAVQGFAESIVLAADTTVVGTDGKRILGKPENAADAVRMLRQLRGKSHTVLTGYCLAQGTKVFSRVVASRVVMRDVKLSVLEAYVATGEPLDKAGAYGIQGLGGLLVESIRGSYTNIVGLPVSHVVADLEEHFGIRVL